MLPPWFDTLLHGIVVVVAAAAVVVVVVVVFLQTHDTNNSSKSRQPYSYTSLHNTLP